MPTDLRLPTACDHCDRSWLAPPEEAALCHFCDGPARVVPGESYRAEDVSLFERIERAVHAAQLSERASQQLCNALNSASERGRHPDLLLHPAVVSALPALRFIREVFADDPAQLARAVGVVLVVISAHLHALDSRTAPAPSF